MAKRTWRNAKEYTVALSAIYTAVVDAETMWEAEEFAGDQVENRLKENDVEEIDTYIIDERASRWVADEYEIKMKINMVIPVMAFSFRDAWDEAVKHIENIEMPDGVDLESTAEIDMSLSEDRYLLVKTS